MPEQPSRAADFTVAGIRRRPAMFIGSTEFFGFVQYIVSAFDIMLDHGATWIEFEAREHSFCVSSDAFISVSIDDTGALDPFEVWRDAPPRHAPDPIILNALSESFRATLNDGTTEATLVSKHGVRTSFRQAKSPKARMKTLLEFSPDSELFSVTGVSPAVVESYCKRTACLHSGVAFRIKVNDDVVEFKSTGGVQEFFAAITTPYQILHKPIHVFESESALLVEAVFAFHSWSEQQIWSFANKGRVPDGGTHEEGFLDAISQSDNHPDEQVGVLAVLAFEYPDVAYEGCIKAQVGNPELRDAVRRLVIKGLQKWLLDNPDEVEHLKNLERFQFAEAW